MKKIDELHPLLVGHSHWFNVLEVERVLCFSSVKGCLVDSHTAHHVRIAGSEPIGHGIEVSRMVSISVVADDVITVAGTGSGIRGYFNSLVLNFLEVHLFGTVVGSCVSLSNPICSIAYIYIGCILQI